MKCERSQTRNINSEAITNGAAINTTKRKESEVIIIIATTTTATTKWLKKKQQQIKNINLSFVAMEVKRRLPTKGDNCHVIGKKDMKWTRGMCEAANGSGVANFESAYCRRTKLCRTENS